MNTEKKIRKLKSSLSCLVKVASFEDDFWIGANTVILDGSVIRRGVVVGSHSLGKRIFRRNGVYGWQSFEIGGVTRMITVLGASGFIGSAIVKRLKELNLKHFVPGRDEDIRGKKLGKVIYCIGITADFRTRPIETVDAHVGKLSNLLSNCDFESIVYLSSTRLYKSTNVLGQEDNIIEATPLLLDDIYNISKLMGESLLFSCGKKATAVRLSNVYGLDTHSNNFLPSIIKDAIWKKRIRLLTSLSSAKDYISLNDVVSLILKITMHGHYQIYNVASGINTSNLEITQKLEKITGCKVETDKHAIEVQFPQISISRIKEEFSYIPSLIVEDLEGLVGEYYSLGGINDYN
ncbi:NAD-dependent epimerase/dehydratase family protein [Anaerospora sp.]|uniref:NAD-dependent epimerase/dehydratase family protein n=1 Tax=Anaerospora sp. TaxID=1960278 RepID=UPI00289D3A9F|nr:NAD-dependent epimerase/dehydratase family protein [Anaerospora sp.]